ncbi:MAG: hypothetical protein A2901_00880 [Elusimicrobia bacterium RIFCSPLOWO2_01_FULL_54_10]|nr:MAG: hypothetical protein A2901_00880 [Elusimicrobia bacterium RIFCSPLOWO2_01_FULL_54_10]
MGRLFEFAGDIISFKSNDSARESFAAIYSSMIEFGSQESSVTPLSRLASYILHGAHDIDSSTQNEWASQLVGIVSRVASNEKADLAESIPALEQLAFSLYQTENAGLSMILGGAFNQNSILKLTAQNAVREEDQENRISIPNFANYAAYTMTQFNGQSMGALLQSKNMQFTSDIAVSNLTSVLDQAANWMNRNTVSDIRQSLGLPALPALETAPLSSLAININRLLDATVYSFIPQSWANRLMLGGAGIYGAAPADLHLNQSQAAPVATAATSSWPTDIEVSVSANASTLVSDEVSTPAQPAQVTMAAGNTLTEVESISTVDGALEGKTLQKVAQRGVGNTVRAWLGLMKGSGPVHSGGSKLAVMINYYYGTAKVLYQGHNPESTRQIGDVRLTSDVDESRHADFGASQGILEQAISYLPAGLQAHARKLNLITVVPPRSMRGKIYSGEALAEASNYLNMVRKNNMVQFLAVLSAAATDKRIFQKWEGMDVFLHLLGHMKQNGPKETKEEAIRMLERILDTLIKNFGDLPPEAAVAATAYVMSVLRAPGEGRMPKVVDLSLSKRWADDPEMMKSAEEIYAQVLIYLNRIENQPKVKADAIAGAVKTKPGADPSRFIYHSLEDSTELKAFQVAEPGVTRGNIYITEEMWAILKANPLALAQLLAHEAYHLDRKGQEAIDINLEEWTAATQEEIVAQEYASRNSGHNEASLDSLLPKIVGDKGNGLRHDDVTSSDRVVDIRGGRLNEPLTGFVVGAMLQTPLLAPVAEALQSYGIDPQIAGVVLMSLSAVGLGMSIFGGISLTRFVQWLRGRSSQPEIANAPAYMNVGGPNISLKDRIEIISDKQRPDQYEISVNGERAGSFTLTVTPADNSAAVFNLALFGKFRGRGLGSEIYTRIATLAQTVRPGVQWLKGPDVINPEILHIRQKVFGKVDVRTKDGWVSLQDAIGRYPDLLKSAPNGMIEIVRPLSVRSPISAGTGTPLYSSAIPGFVPLGEAIRIFRQNPYFGTLTISVFLTSIAALAGQPALAAALAAATAVGVSIYSAKTQSANPSQATVNTALSFAPKIASLQKNNSLGTAALPNEIAFSLTPNLADPVKFLAEGHEHEVSISLWEKLKNFIGGRTLAHTHPSFITPTVADMKAVNKGIIYGANRHWSYYETNGNNATVVYMTGMELTKTETATLDEFAQAEAIYLATVLNSPRLIEPYKQALVDQKMTPAEVIRDLIRTKPQEMARGAVAIAIEASSLENASFAVSLRLALRSFENAEVLVVDNTGQLDPALLNQDWGKVKISVVARPGNDQFRLLLGDGKIDAASLHENVFKRGHYDSSMVITMNPSLWIGKLLAQITSTDLNVAAQAINLVSGSTGVKAKDLTSMIETVSMDAKAAQIVMFVISQ